MKLLEKLYTQAKLIDPSIECVNYIATLNNNIVPKNYPNEYSVGIAWPELRIGLCIENHRSDNGLFYDDLCHQDWCILRCEPSDLKRMIL